MRSVVPTQAGRPVRWCRPTGMLDTGLGARVPETPAACGALAFRPVLVASRLAHRSAAAAVREARCLWKDDECVQPPKEHASLGLLGVHCDVRVPAQIDAPQSRRTVPTPATSAPGLGPPLPHPSLHRDWAHPLPNLHQDWSHPCHICTGTGPTPATSAPGLGSTLPHLHRDWAHPCHICTGTGLTPAHICTGTARRCVARAARDGRTRCRVRLRRSERSGACAACRDAAARIRSHRRTRHASDHVPPPASGRANTPSRVLAACSRVLRGYSAVLHGTNQVLRGVSHQRLIALHGTGGWWAYGSDCVADHCRPRSPSIMNAAHFCHSQRFQRTAAGMNASTGDRRSAIGSDR